MDVHDAGSLRKVGKATTSSLREPAQLGRVRFGAVVASSAVMAVRAPGRDSVSTRTASRWRLLRSSRRATSRCVSKSAPRRLMVHASASALGNPAEPEQRRDALDVRGVRALGQRRQRLDDRPRHDLDGLTGAGGAFLARDAPWRQHEGIRHDDDAAAERRRELPPTDGLDSAVLDAPVAQRRILEDRRDDLARRRQS